MTGEAGSGPDARRPAPWTMALVWALAAALALAAAARLADVATDQLAAPFDLTWETPGLRTVQLLRDGRDPYDPAVYAAPPFWLTPYTPLYPWLVAQLPQDPGNPFLTGRWVSLASMLLAAGGLLVAGGRARHLALLALGAFFLLRPAVTGAAYLKNDALALLFSVVTVLAAHRGGRGGRGWLLLAALAGSAALLTKQSYVAASAAAALWLLWVEPRRALLFGAAHAACTAVPLALLWDDGFRFSVFESLRNPMTAGQFADGWRSMLPQPVFVLIAAWSLGAAVVAIRRGREGSFARAPFALYGLSSTVVMLLTLGKAGSWVNYFLEPALACLLALVEAGRHAWTRVGTGAARHVARAVPLAAVLLAVAGAVEWIWHPGDAAVRLITPESSVRRQADLAFVADAISGLGVPDPLILNLYSTTVSHPLPGTVCANDPFHYFLLYESGKLSTATVVDALNARAFDGVLARARLLELTAPSSPMGSLHRALQRNYRVGLELGPMAYLVPDAPRAPGR